MLRIYFFQIFAKNRKIDLESSGLLHYNDKSLYFMCLEGIYKELLLSTVTLTVIVSVRRKVYKSLNIFAISQIMAKVIHFQYFFFRFYVF